MSFPPSYNLRAQSPFVDQVRDVCDHHSSYPHGVCSYCQSFDYDVNSCPCYDIFNESYARVNVVLETMNVQHNNFISETYPSLPFPTLEASLHDDCESSLPLKSNVVVMNP